MISGSFSNLNNAGVLPNSIYTLDQNGTNREEIGYSAVVGNVGWTPTSTHGSIYVYLNDNAFVSIKKNEYDSFEKSPFINEKNVFVLDRFLRSMRCVSMVII